MLFGVLLYVLTRCYGARWSSDLFRTISIRQRVHQEIAEKAESGKEVFVKFDLVGCVASIVVQ